METTKKRGLYLSLDHNIDIKNDDINNEKNGITKKIISQYLCLTEYGYKMSMLCPYKRRNHRIHSIVRRLPFSGLIPYGERYIKNANKFSFIYLRKPWFMNTDTPSFINKMKKVNPKLKVIVEIPTFDPNSAEKGEINHWHMWPLYYKDKIAMKHINKWADRILTFSRDDYIYGVKTIKTSNAINPRITKKINYKGKKDNTINLIACSSMAFWHGYDRLIEGLHEYVNTGNGYYKILLHLVGDGEELVKYKDLITQYRLNKYIFVHGFKSGKELDNIYDLCDIAIDSLGRHRSNIYYNSSLKGKEYLAKGLPVISGVENELDYDPSFKYYMRVPADDSPINMTDIINFYQYIYETDESRDDIINNISSYAKKNFSYSAAFKIVSEYIN